jgi:hypothetical protein
MEKLNDSIIVKNAEQIENWVTKLGPIRSKQVVKMFEEIGQEFFSAPASSREDYHGCFPGGLADHSLRVINVLIKLAGALAPNKYSLERLIFLGLMHDLGKVGDGKEPLYLPNPSEWHRKKGMLYETNPKLMYMPICDRTIYLLNKFGITLTEEEYIAIRISDGPYEKCNEKYGMKEPDLALLLHFADRWACAIEKQS